MVIKLDKEKSKNYFIIFFIVIMLFLTQTPLGTANYALLNSIYVTINIVVVMMLFVQRRRIKIAQLYSFSLLVVPFLCLFVLSCFLAPFRGGIALKSTIRENFTVILVMSSVLLYLIFRERLINYIFYACIINYSLYLLIFISLAGLRGLLDFVELNKLYGGVLEVHEVTYIIGILLIYYLFHNQDGRNTNRIIVAAAYVVFGFKRILFAALLLALAAYLVLVRKATAKKTLLFSFALFFMCVVWLFFVTSPYYELTAKALHINLMGRTFASEGLYGRLNGYYSMSPIYIGYGVGFVHRTMIAYAQHHEYAGTTAFHNDILKYYIDIGFVPWMIFFGNMTMGIANRIRKKISINSANRYLLMLTMTLVCWMTDNLDTYPNYVVVSNLLYISVMIEGFFEPMDVRKGIVIKKKRRRR